MNSPWGFLFWDSPWPWFCILLAGLRCQSIAMRCLIVRWSPRDGWLLRALGCVKNKLDSIISSGSCSLPCCLSASFLLWFPELCISCFLQKGKLRLWKRGPFLRTLVLLGTAWSKTVIATFSMLGQDTWWKPLKKKKEFYFSSWFESRVHRGGGSIRWLLTIRMRRDESWGLSWSVEWMVVLPLS